jgi:hypothetical protein
VGVCGDDGLLLGRACLPCNYLEHVAPPFNVPADEERGDIVYAECTCGIGVPHAEDCPALIEARAGYHSCCLAPAGGPHPKRCRVHYEHVQHPAHYAGNGLEAITVIEAWELGFCEGNAVKYISRAGNKPGSTALEDARKCLWYVRRWVEQLTRASGGGSVYHDGEEG